MTSALYLAVFFVAFCLVIGVPVWIGEKIHERNVRASERLSGRGER